MAVAKRTSSLPPIRSVGFLLVPGFALMAYSAAVEPLRAANKLSNQTLYSWFHISVDGGLTCASSGAAIMPDQTLDTIDKQPDLILVCAGGNPSLFEDQSIIAWLRRAARNNVVIGGISGGPYILAKAGLLDGYRCTLHWEHAPAFIEAFPEAHLTRSLFEIDGRRITCSGGIAALDLMIALIGGDHGVELAAAVSDWLLHTQIRDGVRPHRMSTGSRYEGLDKPMLATIDAMEAHIEEPLSRSRLAAISGLSLRQLERRFQRHFGYGVHHHYLDLRLERAKTLLRETAASVTEVSIATGFASASQFSRAFKKRIGRSPAIFRGSR